VLTPSPRPVAGPARARVLVEAIAPQVDGGRYPLKRIAGEPIEVWADILREGHDQLAAELIWRKETATEWHREPMRLYGNDRWQGHFTPSESGRYLFEVEAWTDRFATWRHGLLLKRDAGQDITLELREGREILNDVNLRDLASKRLIERAWKEFDRSGDANLLLSQELADAAAGGDHVGRGNFRADFPGADGGDAGNGASQQRCRGRSGGGACGDGRGDARRDFSGGDGSLAERKAGGAGGGGGEGSGVELVAIGDVP